MKLSARRDERDHTMRAHFMIIKNKHKLYLV